MTMKKNGRCSFPRQLMLVLLLGILCITLCACQPPSGTTPTPGTKPTPTPGGSDTPTTEQTLTITFDPMNNAYLVLGEKVGNAFRDGLQLQ